MKTIQLGHGFIYTGHDPNVAKRGLMSISKLENSHRSRSVIKDETVPQVLLRSWHNSEQKVDVHVEKDNSLHEPDSSEFNMHIPKEHTAILDFTAGPELNDMTFLSQNSALSKVTLRSTLNVLNLNSIQVNVENAVQVNSKMLQIL